VYVIVWEPKHGRGGGHQLVLDKGKADHLGKVLSRQLPGDTVKVMPADAYAAAAVMGRLQRRMQ
jgi:hypothetical protein